MQHPRWRCVRSDTTTPTGSNVQPKPADACIAQVAQHRQRRQRLGCDASPRKRAVASLCLVTFTDMQKRARGRQRQQSDDARARGLGAFGGCRRSNAHEDVVLILDVDDRGLVLRLEHVTEDVPHDGRGRVDRDAAINHDVRAGQDEIARERHVRLGRRQADATGETSSRNGACAGDERQTGKSADTHAYGPYQQLRSRCPGA